MATPPITTMCCNTQITILAHISHTVGCDMNTGPSAQPAPSAPSVHVVSVTFLHRRRTALSPPGSAPQRVIVVVLVTGGDQHGQQQDGGQRGAVRDGAHRHGHQVRERPARESSTQLYRSDAPITATRSGYLNGYFTDLR